MVETNSIEASQSSTCGAVTAAIVNGIASESGCDPIEIDVCLGEHLDPDALDALFASAVGQDTTFELTATIDTYHVRIDSSGYVSVSDLSAMDVADGTMVEI